jgi:hypothetical protein
MRLDHLALRSNFVTCFTNFICATHGPGIPTLPITLLTSSSGCAGLSDTAPTSVPATGKGCTGGTSGQPSSDDHAGEARLLATSQ